MGEELEDAKEKWAGLVREIIRLWTNLVHPMPPLNMMPICNTASFQASCEYHSARLLVPKSLQPTTTRQEDEMKKASNL